MIGDRHTQVQVCLCHPVFVLVKPSQEEQCASHVQKELPRLALSSLKLPRFMQLPNLCPTLQASNRPVKTAGQQSVQREQPAMVQRCAEHTSEHRTY